MLKGFQYIGLIFVNMWKYIFENQLVFFFASQILSLLVSRPLAQDEIDWIRISLFLCYTHSTPLEPYSKKEATVLNENVVYFDLIRISDRNTCNK
jgi:hypothetical protein